MTQPVIVIGGGPAGIAAACALAMEGVRTVLLEQRVRMGVRSSAVFYQRMQEEADYGQHILMRCCRESIALLSTLGQEGSVSFQSRLKIPIAGGRWAGAIASAPLPGALHLMPTLLSYGLIPFRRRLRIVQAIPSLLLQVPGDVLFSEWLKRHGQRDDAIAALWDPICVATLNAHASQVSARAAQVVFQRGFFRRHGADIGLFTRPLSQIFAATIPYLSRRGSEVFTGRRVKRLLFENGAVTGIELTTGERILGSAVIAAIPPHDLSTLIFLNESPVQEYFARTARLPHSPIVNLHLWYDRPVMEDAFVIGIDSPVQSVFNVTAAHAAAKGSRHDGEKAFHIVISQSEATDWIELSTETIKNSILPHIPLLVPAVRKASLVDALVLKSPKATFIPVPGSDRLRPSPRTPIKGLFTAGDHIATGWPSTIEGAIRSGRMAATCAIESLYR